MQINAALFNVEFIKHAVIANSQLEFGSALKALVREVSQSCAYLVYLALNCIADGCRKGLNPLENVGDQIWSAAATIHFGCRVVY